MQPSTILVILVAYFLLLLFIGWFTGRKQKSEGYFLGNKQSIWWLVAIGMLSDSMSGVTFISVPGNVVNSKMYYMQLVMGYCIGYIVIAFVLLPLYYKRNLTSIYTYLEQRFGKIHQVTGAFYFILSRLVGSAARLYLAIEVLDKFLFSQWNIPFYVSVVIVVVLILLYTIKGGIRTLVFTDALQSAFLLGGLLLSVYAILSAMPDKNLSQLLLQSPHFEWFNWDAMSKTFFVKHFIGGAVICIAMTGLDQNMMQKNLSCKSLKDAQKNILTYGMIVFVVNFIFLSLGVLLYAYAQEKNIQFPVNAKGALLTDKVFPTLALEHLGLFSGVAFILGLAAATFSSADSVLTSLTTSTYFDLLHIQNKEKTSESTNGKLIRILHILFALLLCLVILIFKHLQIDGLINTILDIASYTYGPLLGLFGFGLLSKAIPKGFAVVVVCVLAPVITYFLTLLLKSKSIGYEIGNEALLINGLITFLGLYLISIFQKNRLEVI